MTFDSPLIKALLRRRYKRFLADVELEDGKIMTVHCPNSGSMLGCDAPGSEVRISESNNAKRKYPHTLEMVKINGVWVGINTSRTNGLVEEALKNGTISDFGNIGEIKREVKVSEKSRLDFKLLANGATVFLEVKNCSLAMEGTALFPDAVTTRGAKHLEELMELKDQGHGAAVLFCVQRNDAEKFAPASQIDPAYAKTLLLAENAGVAILAYRAEVSPNGIKVATQLPVDARSH